MKELADLLNSISHSIVAGSATYGIDSIQFDSRFCTSGSIFVALKGMSVDGHDYLLSAYENGCRVFMVDRPVVFSKTDVCLVKVSNSSQALALLADSFYDSPSKEIKLIGITGTNGKTTCATLMHDLFTSLGYSSGLLSTVVNKVGATEVKATHTTPDPIALNALLREMILAGCTYCFMEVSSHAIVQNRIYGLSFTGGVFTNISHDHLDYHETFASYIAAKKQFFDHLSKDAFALVNIDDKNGKVMLQNTNAKKLHYALRSPADFKAKVIENELSGLLLNLDGTEFYSRLIGRFNAYNLLTVYAVSIILGVDKMEALGALSNLHSVEGRFQYLKVPNGPTVIVDYAHTPDALENVLQTVLAIKKTTSRVLTVVGCGGDRDIEKRPIMALLASEMSDELILTSDNPRSEDPEHILVGMHNGLSESQKDAAFTLVDRKEAIKLAIKLAKPDDVVLIAGKGHEKYQEIKGVRHHFDDFQIASDFTNQMNK